MKLKIRKPAVPQTAQKLDVSEEMANLLAAYKNGTNGRTHNQELDVKKLTVDQAKRKLTDTSTKKPMAEPASTEPDKKDPEYPGYMPTSLRLDFKTRKRIAYLAKKYGNNKTEAIRVAVKLLYRAHRERDAEERGMEDDRARRVAEEAMAPAPTPTVTVKRARK